MILMVMIYMDLIKMVVISIAIKKNQVKLKLAKQNLLKSKKEKVMSIYLLLYLKYIIIVQKN